MGVPLKTNSIAQEYVPARPAPRGTCSPEFAAPANNREAKRNASDPHPVVFQPTLLRKLSREAVSRLYVAIFPGRTATEMDAQASVALGLSMESCGHIRRGKHSTSADNFGAMLFVAMHYRQMTADVCSSDLR